MSQQGGPVQVGTRAVDVFLFLGMLGCLMLLLGLVVRAWIPPASRQAKLAEFSHQSWTSGIEAHVMVTNTSPSETLWFCYRGVVATKKGVGRAETLVVCSGDIKPHSTVDVRAPYEVHAVEDICSDDVGEGLYRRKELNWDRCSYTAEEQ